MFVQNVRLKNFRNLQELNIELSEGINIIHGNNAQGKTNFLESIYLCGVGRSHRSNNHRDMIHFDKKEAFINVVLNDDGSKDKISVYLRKDEKKGIAINNIPIKKTGDLLGTLLTVIFSPEDLLLVKSGPSERRRFMDMEICQLSNIYYYELNSYHKVLKQRNNLLKSISKNKALKDTVFIWDEQLMNHGTKIYNYRKEFIEDLNIISSNIYSDITNNKESLEITYKPNVNPHNFMEKLNKNMDKDILFGTTSTGIHKDDCLFTIDGVDVRTFGSQGQQRTASLAAKLAEIKLIENRKNRLPVLLLDDVLSELDSSRQYYLLNSLKDIQTIITCTGVDDILNKVNDFHNLKIFQVSDGVLIEHKKE